jgi:hypothetical protein
VAPASTTAAEAVAAREATWAVAGKPVIGYDSWHGKQVRQPGDPAGAAVNPVSTSLPMIDSDMIVDPRRFVTPHRFVADRLATIQAR